MKRYWEIIADNLSKAGWTWGCVATVDAHGRRIWIADAHRHDGQRFVSCDPADARQDDEPPPLKRGE